MRTAAVVLLSLVAIVAVSISSRPSHVEISGHVYGGVDGAPVVGATVSNDWDSTTVTTNALGEFRMRVRRVAVDEFIQFTARSGETAGCHRRIGSFESRRVDIVLNDPTQSLWRCRPESE
jgi:hypothetical protein